MKRLTALLKALKIFDPDNTLSLSNIAMMVVIVKLATAQSLDWAVLTSFFLVLLNHNARKAFRAKSESKTMADQDRLSHIEDTIRSVKNAIAFKK
jgi:hypothetical protein